jgi:dihydrofolate reductase
VIGGGEIYVQAMPRAARMVITWVKLRPEGDASFPPIDPAVWEELERTDHVAGPDDDAGYAIVTYRRRAMADTSAAHSRHSAP